MVLLEDQHGPQTHSALTATTNVDTNALALDKELVTLRSIPGNKCTLALTTQVLQVLRVLLSQTLEASKEVGASGSCVLDERQALDFLDDAAEDEGTGWVTHPGVELAVGLVGTQGGVTVIVTGGLSLLREGDHVRRGLEVPVVVGPELSSGTDTSLDLVDDEEDVVALGDLTETLEERG
jgi:hypothetical protein